MPKSTNRTSQRLRLNVASARTVRISATDAPPLLPWPVAAIGGGALAALAGALVVTGVVMVAWLSAITIAMPRVLSFAAQVWLLAHGGVLQVADTPVTLAPLGLSLLALGLCGSIGGFAYRQGRQSHTEQLTRRQQQRLVAGSVAQVMLGYTAFAVLLAWTTTGAEGILHPALGAAAISGVGAGIGALLATQWRPHAGWVRGAIRGTFAGVLALFAAAALVFALALILGETRIAGLEAGLGLDGTGTAVWAVVAVAYLPNLLAWTASWLLGAGFTVGTGSLVSLSTTQLGMLPAVPVFGALPSAGVAPIWLLGFGLFGIAAGAVAGVVAARDLAELAKAIGTAALAGVGVGLVYLVLAVASRGALGELRLTELGPRPAESAAIALPLLVFSAALAGLVAWFVRRRSSQG